ncbi:MAG: hypothetical protein IMW91_10380 [Firmicutes bacterium]|nr:hypothetical protein [Bacillota bacterium]
MARVVLGIGTSHSPQVNTTPDVWALHADRDAHNPELDFEGLARQAPAWMANQLRPEVWQEKYETCQSAVETLSRALHDAQPDVVLVIGDDQEELFLDDGKPAIAVFHGTSVQDLPADPLKMHPSFRPALWAMHGEQPEAYPTNAELGYHLVSSLTASGFDVTALTRQPEGRTLGHAYTFVRRRLMRDRVVPMVPLFLNCYYPPNQPSPGRCYDLGRALRYAIDAWPQEVRVALVASGGLSHFVIDEMLDQQVLEGLKTHDREKLAAIPDEKLQSGSSEIRNWIAVGGAMDGLDMEVVAYVPGYRSMAGTGCAMTFALWR